MSVKLERVSAWAIHLLTASGAVWGILALVATADGRLKQAFGWMLVALIVDSVDGTLARRIRVSQILPQIDGALLDNLVDYLNYAVVPAFVLYRSGLLPDGYGLVAALFICLTSAFQFTHEEAKSRDHLFRGFPSYWNVVAFYLWVLELDQRLNLAIVLTLVALSFLPVYHLYPSRTPTLRPLTLVLTVIWGGCVAILLVQHPNTSRWLVYASLGYLAYYFGLSLVMTMRRRSENE